MYHARVDTRAMLARECNIARLSSHQSCFAMMAFVTHNLINDPANLGLFIYQRWRTLTKVELAFWLPRKRFI